MKKNYSTFTLGLLLLSIVFLITASALPSWIVISKSNSGIGNTLLSQFNSYLGLFKHCQGNNNDNMICTNYDRFNCIGNSVTIGICTNRNISAALIVTSIVAAFIATIAYGFFTFYVKLSQKYYLFVIFLFCALSVIFGFASVGIMTEVRHAVQQQVQETASLVRNHTDIYFGSAFIVGIVGSVMSLIASVMVVITFPSMPPAIKGSHLPIEDAKGVI